MRKFLSLIAVAMISGASFAGTTSEVAKQEKQIFVIGNETGTTFEKVVKEVQEAGGVVIFADFAETFKDVSESFRETTQKIEALKVELFEIVEEPPKEERPKNIYIVNQYRPDTKPKIKDARRFRNPRDAI